jgi:hypothetical protein
MLNKKALNVGLCSANFNPDLRKIRSGLNETVFFGHVQPWWAYPVPNWEYVVPILTHLAHPLLGHFSFFSLTKIKFDIFHMLLAKNEAVQGHCIGWGKPTLDANQETIYIYIYIYIFIFIYIYIFVYV